MKRRGRVTHLPSNPIPTCKFIPVTNPRKTQFQPPEKGEKGHKMYYISAGWSRLWRKTTFVDLVVIPGAVLVLSTLSI